MQAAEFIKVVHDVFESWLRGIARDIAKRKLIATGHFSYPNLLRVAETPDHFIGELCGACSPSHSTSVRLHKPQSAERVRSATAYFNGGFKTDEDAQFVASSYSTLRNLTLVTQHDAEVFDKKFAIDLNPTIFTGSYSRTTPLGVSPDVTQMCLRNIDIVRTDAFRVVFRTINTAVCVRKEISSSELASWLQRLCHRRSGSDAPLGLNLNSDNASIEFGRQLASLSEQNVTEASLDRFIQAHGEHFQSALGYKSYLSQPRLRWISRGELDPCVSVS